MGRGPSRETIVLERTHTPRFCIHLSDLHLRNGDLETSRFSEYAAVIDSAVEKIASEPSVKACDALAVITGDVFHHKTVSDTAPIALFHRLMMGVADLLPVVVIEGNHDFRQDRPSELGSLSTFLSPYTSSRGAAPSGDAREGRATRYPIHMLDTTGRYQYGDATFCFVSVRDTLDASRGCGIVAHLPQFPRARVSDGPRTMALFHGSVRTANGAGGGARPDDTTYPLSWISASGCNFAALGDIHRRQSGSFEGMVWAYAGSLVQQNRREHVLEHGGLVWDLDAPGELPRPFDIYNAFAQVRVVTRSERLFAVIVGGDGVDDGSCDQETVPLEEVASVSLFPRRPHLHTIGASTSRAGTVDSLPACIAPSAITAHDTRAANARATDGSRDERSATIEAEVARYSSPEFWIENMHGLSSSAASMVRDPGTRMWPPGVTESDRPDLRAALDRYASSADARRVDRTTLVQARWSNLFGYGNDNWISYADMRGDPIALIAPNTWGKSAACVDIPHILLFGTPGRDRMRYAASTPSARVGFVHDNGGTPRGELWLETAGTLYRIERAWTRAKGGRQQAKAIAGAGSFRANVSRVHDESRGVVVAKDATSVAKWVAKHIGCEEHFHRNCVMSSRNSVDFLAMGDKAREATLEDIFDLSRIRSFAEAARCASLASDWALSRARARFRDRATELGVPETASLEDIGDHVLRARERLSEASQVLDGLNDGARRLATEVTRLERCSHASPGCPPDPGENELLLDTRDEADLRTTICKDLSFGGGCPDEDVHSALEANLDAREIVRELDTARERTRTLELALERAIAARAVAEEDGERVRSMSEAEAALARTPARPDESVADLTSRRAILSAMARELEAKASGARPLSIATTRGPGAPFPLPRDVRRPSTDEAANAVRRAEERLARAREALGAVDRADRPEGEEASEKATDDRPGESECDLKALRSTVDSMRATLAGWSPRAGRAEWTALERSFAELMDRLGQSIPREGEEDDIRSEITRLEALAPLSREASRLEELLASDRLELSRLVEEGEERARTRARVHDVRGRSDDARSRLAAARAAWFAAEREGVDDPAAACETYSRSMGSVRDVERSIQGARERAERSERRAREAQRASDAAARLDEIGTFAVNPACEACRANPLARERQRCETILDSIGPADRDAESAEREAADARSRVTRMDAYLCGAEAMEAAAVASTLERELEEAIANDRVALDRERRIAHVRADMRSRTDALDTIRAEWRGNEAMDEADICERLGAARARLELVCAYRIQAGHVEAQRTAWRLEDSAAASRETMRRDLALAEWTLYHASRETIERLEEDVSRAEEAVALCACMSDAVFRCEERDFRAELERTTRELDRVDIALHSHKARDAAEARVAVARDVERARLARDESLQKASDLEIEVRAAYERDRARRVLVARALEIATRRSSEADARRIEAVRGVASLEERVRSTVKRAEDLANAARELSDTETHHATALELYAAFVRSSGPRSSARENDGLCATIYRRHILPYFTGHANAYLAGISDLKVLVSREGVLYFETRDGAVYDSTGTSTYQRECLTLAFRCALNKLGTFAFNMPHIFIDEGFGNFDETNISRVEEFLDRLRTAGGFETVMLCSHLDVVKTAARRHMAITRVGNTSCLRWPRSETPPRPEPGVRWVSE